MGPGLSFLSGPGSEIVRNQTDTNKTNGGACPRVCPFPCPQSLAKRPFLLSAQVSALASGADTAFQGLSAQ